MPTINDRIGSQNVIRVLANASAPPTRLNNLTDVDSAREATNGLILIWSPTGGTAGDGGYLLGNDIDLCVDELENNFTWYKNLSDARQRVLVNMCFNLGLTRLLGFKKFLAALEAEDWDRAAEEMLDSKWAVQVGPRSTRLRDLLLEG